MGVLCFFYLDMATSVVQIGSIWRTKCPALCHWVDDVRVSQYLPPFTDTFKKISNKISKTLPTLSIIIQLGTLFDSLRVHRPVRLLLSLNYWNLFATNCNIRCSLLTLLIVALLSYEQVAPSIGVQPTTKEHCFFTLKVHEIRKYFFCRCVHSFVKF